jgi:hypothetical protein
MDATKPIHAAAAEPAKRFVGVVQNVDNAENNPMVAIESIATTRNPDDAKAVATSPTQPIKHAIAVCQPALPARSSRRPQ